VADHVRTSVTIEKELLELAKKYRINLSRALEEKLVEILREKYGIEYTTNEYIINTFKKKRKLKKVIETIEKIKKTTSS